MADPGFPMGGTNPVEEGADVPHRHFLEKKTKMKELGAVGGWGLGVGGRRGVPPGSTTEDNHSFMAKARLIYLLDYITPTEFFSDWRSQ